MAGSTCDAWQCDLPIVARCSNCTKSYCVRHMATPFWCTGCVAADKERTHGRNRIWAFLALIPLGMCILLGIGTALGGVPAIGIGILIACAVIGILLIGPLRGGG